MATTIFTCECGNVRKVPNAARHEVTRCDECQIEYKRRKARERYRRRKGLALDYVPPAHKEKTKEKYKSSWLDFKPKPEPPPPIPKRSPEEQAARSKKIASLFSLLEDDSTDDDW